MKLKSSYPTYEEWKQLSWTTSDQAIGGSYPTYEEWKRFLKSKTTTWNVVLVLILPMRNGNYVAYIFMGIHPYPVLILPMRNGNL